MPLFFVNKIARGLVGSRTILRCFHFFLDFFAFSRYTIS